MASNSKDDLLAELSKGDAMHGWGAMLSIGRDRFNQLLQDRFVEAFATQDFIVPFSGEYYADNNTEKVVFANIMFGPPQVSFRAASGRSARVKLSMELIAGRCSMIAEYPGEPAFLRRSHVLQPGMGFRFEVTVDLQVVRSRNADKGQLVIDWSTVSDPVCNLAPTPNAESTMGAYLLRQLGPQLRNWALPVVTIEFHFGYSALSVVDFTVVAQKAPEGGGQRLIARGRWGRGVAHAVKGCAEVGLCACRVALPTAVERCRQGQLRCFAAGKQGLGPPDGQVRHRRVVAGGLAAET